MIKKKKKQKKKKKKTKVWHQYVNGIEDTAYVK